MRQRKQDQQESEQKQIVIVDDQDDKIITNFAGSMALKRMWQELDVSRLLEESGIRYGQEENKANSMSFPQKQQLVSALGDGCPAIIGHC